MGTFLRLQVFARKAGDDEFVEALRRDLKARPRRRAIRLAAGLGLILLAILWTLTVPRMLWRTLSQRADDVLVPALTFGIAAGAVAAAIVLFAVRLIAESQASLQDRMGRLLIDYHDRLARETPAGDEERK